MSKPGEWQSPLDFGVDDLTFDPHNFGAVGDGIADDTEAVQASFDAAARAGGRIGGEPGTYKVTRPITDQYTPGLARRRSATNRNGDCA